MKIIKTNPSDADFHLFENLANVLYEANSVRHKQSDSLNLEYLSACYILTINDLVVLRLAIYDNPYFYYESKKVICIGNYEAFEDAEIATIMINHAKSEAKKLGAEYIIGPMNGSTWDAYRFSVSHDAPPFLMENYHHLYYNQHFTDNGFGVIGGYFSSKDTTLLYDAVPVLEREAALIADGVTFRNVELEHFDAELERLFDFNEMAFKTNFLYTPISKTAFLSKYKDTKRIINPDFVILAEDADKNLLGYFFCIQDFYNTNEKSLILKTIARHPDPRWRGLGHVIGNLIYRKAVEQGFTSIIHAFMYDEGYSTTISKNFSGNRYKYYHLYGQEI